MMYRYKLMFRIPQAKAWLTRELTRARIVLNIDRRK